MTRAEQVRRYEELCEARCDGEGTFDPEVAAAWAALPLLVRLRMILAPAIRDALHELIGR